MSDTQLNLFTNEVVDRLPKSDIHVLKDGRRLYRVEGPFRLQRPEIVETRYNDGFIVEDLTGNLSVLSMDQARSIGIV